MIVALVFVGGAVGAPSRYLLDRFVQSRHRWRFPLGTIAVNVIGCLVIGALAGRIASGRLHMTPAMRTFVFVGLLGGFTTFSSFGLDTFTLAHGGDHSTAFWNVAGQVGLGLGAVYLGFNLGL